MGVLFTFLLFLLNCSLSAAANKLKLSILMFRHGDRSPTTNIPNDIYTTDSWPQGPGQLSVIGKESHLENGKFFRARYTDPNSETYLGLNPDYERVEVYVQSTDKDRTLMSAESFLAGLFPPPANNNLTNPLDVWQPIPVHTRPYSTEKMLDGPPVPCKAFQEGYHETMMHNTDFVSFMKTNKETTKKIFDVCGWRERPDLLATMKVMESTYDTLFCEISHNFTLAKEFVEADLYNLIVPYSKVRWGLWNAMTDREKAFNGGVLLHELKTRVRDALEGKNEHKLVIFSGHDYTLAAILTCLGVYDGVQTPYATVLAVEVWETEEGSHVIKLIRHHKDEDLISYTLPGCQESGCTEEQFYSLNANLEMSEDDILDQCNEAWPDMVPSLNKNVLFVLLCVTILITLSSLIVTTLYLCNLKKKTTYASLAAEDPKQSLLEEEDSLA